MNKIIFELQRFTNISNRTANTVLTSTSDYDNIENYAENVTINALETDALIENYGNNVIINGGDSGFYIENSGDNVLINTGNGDDYYIYNEGSNCTVTTKNGNDEIYNHGDRVFIDAGGDDDIIVHGKDYETIKGGKGNDTISSYAIPDSKVSYGGTLYLYEDGDGDDIILCEDDTTLTGEPVSYTAFRNNDTLQVTGDFSTTTSGDDIIIKVGSGSITLKNTAGKEVHSTKSGNVNNITLSGKSTNSDNYINNVSDNAYISADDYDYIKNAGNYVTISGQGADDLLVSNDGDNALISVSSAYHIGNVGNNVVIYTGAINDDVSNYGENVTIFAGDGDDKIYTCGDNTFVNGGDGNDTIGTINTFAKVNTTIKGGKGNDSMSGSGNLVGKGTIFYQYEYGDGNDSISSFAYGRSGDTLQVAGDFSTMTSGNDLVIKVGDGSITLKDRADKIVVTNKDGNYNLITLNSPSTIPTYIYEGGNATISAGTSWNSSVNNFYSQVNFETALNSFSIGEGNIYLNSNSGTLTIQNARGHYMKYADSSGTPFAYSYVAGPYVNSNSSVGHSYQTIDQRTSGFTYFGVLVGADNINSEIYAGSGGSSMWGGNNSNDTLVGGDGYDEFVFMPGSGSDIIQNASSDDVVNLIGISLDDISNLEVNESAVSVGFKDGGSLRVEGNTGVGYKLGDTTFVCNQATNEWSVK